MNELRETRVATSVPGPQAMPSLESWPRASKARKLFETVVARCMKERPVGGEALAVDASMIVADAHRGRGVAKVEDLDPTSGCASRNIFRF